MSSELTNAERETHLNMTADDRSAWVVCTDDPIMMRKFDGIAEFIRNVGVGKEYRLRTEQVSFRKGKRQLSEAQRTQLANRMRSLRKNAVVA